MHQRIRNDECLICENSLLKGIDLYSFIIDARLCYKCHSQLKSRLTITKFDNYPLVSFYKYNDEVSSLLIRYKDLFDVVLAPVFLERYMWLFNLVYKDYKIIPIPSSDKLIKKRGFSHLSLMLQDSKLEIVDCLEKSDQVQRFSKSRENVKFTLKFIPKDLKKIIIFDDVITSGSSMRAAINLLAPYCTSISLISITTNIKKENNNARKS